MKKILLLFLSLILFMPQGVVLAANSNSNSQYLCYSTTTDELDSLLDDYDDDYDDYEYDDDLESDSQTQGNNFSYWLIALIFIYLIQGIIFGFATDTAIKNKGYFDNWFWWGFFFGLIALLVALSKPDCHASQETISPNPPSRSDETGKNHRWECAFCHLTNEDYITTCCCGKSRQDTEEKLQAEKKKIETKKETKKSETDTIDLLERYKKLLDSGALTQEEFDDKKKEILNN